jgi:cephalosporin hydroxylase/ubiquinone/menaquinone biosynthesis C-methylase UbiE
MRSIPDEFHEIYYDSWVWRHTYWMGVQALKCPLDLWVYQEILFEIRPQFIIETGTAAGGSALFLASICDLLGEGQVVTVDVNALAGRPEHSRITYLQGSSTSDVILSEIKGIVGDARRVLVILDSDHSRDHVLQELRCYSPIVTSGSYLIVEDTNINGHPVLELNGPGPMEGVEAFLTESDDFTTDREREKFFLTFNPKGYLRKAGDIGRATAPAETAHFLSPSGQNESVSDPLPLPSEELQNYVGGGFAPVGAEFLRHFVKLCDLKPNESVLDVGCGSGRMALPLTKYLNADGRYDGFDISADAIKWCSDNITARFSNFKFQLAELQNVAFGMVGKPRASKFTFPHADDEFDLAFLTSVFTHMLPADMKRYLAEIRRVLKPGGRCLITYFLLNDESTLLIDRPQGELNFEHKGDGYRTTNPKNPEDALAYPQAFIERLYANYGFKVREPVYYGSWCGRKNYLSFQDIVIAEKPTG